MRAIGFFVALAASLLARRASAGELQLVWRAPAGCPSSESVRAAALRGAGADRQPLVAEAQVEHGQRWRVTLRTSRDGEAQVERTLDAASCDALAEATSVILAIAMIPPGAALAATPAPPAATAAVPANPIAVDPATATDGGPTPTRAAPTPPMETETPGPHVDGARDDGDLAARQRAARAHAFAISASGTTDGTTLPAAAAGGKLGLAWTPGRARVEVAGSLFPGQSKTTGSSSAGAKLDLLVVGARGCFSLLHGAVELAPCVGADVQVVSARGYGAAHNYDASASWLSATAGGLLRFPLLSWLALRADGNAVVPATRPRFVVEGDGAIHKPAAIGLRAGIGAELLFL